MLPAVAAAAPVAPARNACLISAAMLNKARCPLTGSQGQQPTNGHPSYSDCDAQQSIADPPLAGRRRMVASAGAATPSPMRT